MILCAAGTALAASDLSSLVSTGESDPGSARGAQLPIGIHANPGEGGEGEQGILGAEQGGGTQGGGTQGNSVLGEQAQGGSETGSGDTALPFTGLLAIPILGLGAIFLLAGVTLRRVPRPTTT